MYLKKVKRSKIWNRVSKKKQMRHGTIHRATPSWAFGHRVLTKLANLEFWRLTPFTPCMYVYFNVEISRPHARRDVDHGLHIGQH
jgi:hypothetical protein